MFVLAVLGLAAGFLINVWFMVSIFVLIALFYPAYAYRPNKGWLNRSQKKHSLAAIGLDKARQALASAEDEYGTSSADLDAAQTDWGKQVKRWAMALLLIALVSLCLLSQTIGREWYNSLHLPTFSEYDATVNEFLPGSDPDQSLPVEVPAEGQPVEVPASTPDPPLVCPTPQAGQIVTSVDCQRASP
jgi:hypothetical protein